ncbi:MAG: molecular chaperone HtpG [Spirochaetes bacterium]|nr:molecular chaperone HtpG [Spirochaetota bacterium]
MATHQFQTEVNQLLDLIIHSLYSHREVFLRELVSNASDAVDKLKYLNLSDERYKSLSFEPRIDISFDREAKTLTVGDNGIGMSEADLVDSLGTIARSGTKEFLSHLGDDARKNSNLIGRFGVGFYSAFMVSEKIEVITRKAGEDAAWLWKSDGKGSYEIEESARDGQGTTVLLRLNDEGLEYANRWRLEELVRKYSNHIAYPIILHFVEDEYDDKGKKKGSKAKDERINSAAALWTRPKSELTEADYVDFYKNIADTEEDPLLTIHTRAEGTIEYSTLFFVPSKAPFDIFHADYRPGVKLYVHRVFITDDEKELLPTYLRFLRGVIDSEDLPLNVSREILQQNRVMTNIRNASVKKVLSELKDLSTRDPDRYGKFADEFNRLIKEGLYSDYGNRETLLELVRFKSTAVDGWTSLADYGIRVKDGQKAIYYLTGDSEERLRKSPLLEMYRKEGIEVLLCSDEIDEIVVPSIGKFGVFELKAANRAGAEDDFGTAKDEAKEKEYKPVVDKIRKALGERVKDVRLTSRLTESPSCIVMDADDPSLQFQQLMKAMGREGMAGIKPILEVNGDHAIVKRMALSDDDRLAEDTAFVLLGQALLVEGAQLEDPADFVARLNRLLAS